MDIDGSSLPEEIDQNLLLQFSCMNTTDREELVSQMQRLLGPSLNSNTASFFLDMTNWNLQAAICCYLDYTLPPKLPSMSLKAAQNQETAVGPGTCFEQTWSIANTGTDSWPGSCRLIQAGGEPLGATPVYVPPLPPGHTTTVSLKLVAPSNPGTHRGYFHLVTDRGDQIGDTLWVEITVESEMTMALVEQLAALPIPSSRLEDSVNQMPSQDDQMC
ncbi:protein ILRUN [Amyelois transitella]|uniref:protein ILRUN n=1 Tax=Amyelois transitella TaxID=680683 RepID=UPI00067B3833|nr:protein ILRUN [Amyelois transitella]